MTCLVAKFSPRNDYCPYFFDIVAKTKGIGKSLLCRRLPGGKYCGFLTFAVGRRDDFYVNAYDGNNAIVVDDECTWVSNSKMSGKITADEMKTLVSSPVDKFSRKFGQPEEHQRSFIIMRTSNDVNQVYSTNERRQIIFECHLKEQECRILDLPDEFFQQMLAEAKAYYRKHHGVYQLTDDDKLEVKSANLDNYNWETRENFAILDYVKAVRNEPENELKLYKKWKIYVKTGAEEGLAYRTASSKNSEFDKRLVDIKDYEFAFQMLLTGNSANDVSRGIELAADTTYGIKGAQQFYNRSGKMKPTSYDTAGDYNNALDKLWETMQSE
jgi:hypothetical protein